MSNEKLSVSDILEPFLLGLSCILGGEQFFILLSHTERSIRAQSVILIIISLLTILGFSLLSMNDIILNGIHVLYLILLIFKLMYIRYKVRSLFSITLLIILIGFILSLLILLSCCSYCTSRTRILYFIFGLFGSRFLPTFIWYFCDKRSDFNNQLRTVSTTLAVFRILFCFISILLKIFTDRFNFPLKDTFTESYKGFPSNWPKIKSQLGHHLWKYWFGDFWNVIKSAANNKNYSDFIGQYFPYISPLSTLLPSLTFFSSVSMFLKSPPIINAFYYPYSARMLSTIDILKTIAHLAGSLFGISYPASITGNSHLFYFTIIAFYFLYFSFTILLKKHAFVFDQQYYYLITIISGFVLGYIWTYCLGILVNTTLTQTCIHKEQRKNIIPCCGERVIGQCYCKFSARDPKPNPDTRLDRPGYYSMSFSCSKLKCNGNDKEVYYSRNGCNAILICYNCNGDCQSKTCTGNCCAAPKKDCCLKVRGIFILDTVATSSCADCQLTIRIEARCNKDDCPICPSGAQCCCPSAGENCCCLCVKCCNDVCNGVSQDCCIKFCKGCNGHGTCSCKCKESSAKGDTRLFICGSGTSSTCCIKELRPNFPANFDGSLGKLGEFDIRDITISDCCHTRLRVDLHCTKRDNFFRLSEINFPKKIDKPNKITLTSKCSTCCTKAPATQCCCAYKQMVKLSLEYDGLSSQTSQTTTCVCGGSSGSSSATCSTSCVLTINPYCSFDKKVNEIRVKLVVSWWLLFGISMLLTFFILLIVRGKNKLYEFNPKAKYSDLVKPFNKEDFNSVNHLDDRISAVISDEAVLENFAELKKKEVDSMVSLFNKYLTQKDAIKLSSHISSKSELYMKATKDPEIRKLDKRVAIWGCSVGILCRYTMTLFFEIQKFFILWENLWITEFGKYKQVMRPDLSRISDKSRFEFDLVSCNTTEDKLDSVGLSRLMLWNRVLCQMKKFSSLSSVEVKIHSSSLPLDICDRLNNFVDRWDHRLESIKQWVKLKETMFDWLYFMGEYHHIQSWVFQLTPFLSQASDIRFTPKELNEGTEVFSYIN